MESLRSFKIGEILPAVGGRLIHGNPEMAFTNYCIDSRYVDSRTLFVPLMGQSRDGHQFVIDSISKGAVATFVRSGHHMVHEIVNWLRERARLAGYEDYEDVCVIEVRHTLVALQRLAEWYRQQFPCTVVGVTGSVGKTGTKEMLIQLLSTKHPTVGTEKNFNNEIGVPLALSKITSRTKMAVIEMAMRARGEISLLSRIAQPDIAVVTNTSGSHVGRLGSFEEVIKAKCEIVEGLRPDGQVVLNRNDQNIARVIAELDTRRNGAKPYDIHLFDAEAIYHNTAVPPFMPPVTLNGGPPKDLAPADVWVEDVELRGLDGSRFKLCSKDERVEVDLILLGRGAIENLCAAAGVCHMLGMSLQEVADAAPQLLPAPQRLNLFQLTPSLFLVDDCYNSSPASMRDSLELMVNVDPDYRKILVVGDMLELGKYETILHRQCALTALNLPFDAIYAVGPRMNAVNEVEGNEDIDLYYIEGRSDLEAGGNFGNPDARFGQSFGGREPEPATDKIIFDDRAAEKLSALLLNEVEQHNRPTVVLVKGSRALHLERVVNELLTGTNY